MTSQQFYMPILKAKQGELTALREMDNGSIVKIVPLLEIPAIPWNFEDDAPSKTIDEHLLRLPDNITTNVTGRTRIIIHLDYELKGERMADTSHPLTSIFSRLDAALIACPTVQLSDDQDYLDAIRIVLAMPRGRAGVCLRISTQEVQPINTLNARIDNLLAYIGCSKEEVDLLLDFGFVTDSQAPFYRVMTLVTVINDLQLYRSFTAACTSFPLDLSGVPVNTNGRLRRHEWDFFVNSFGISANFRRFPNFGDYGISHPESTEIDPRMMNPSASIRYTTSNEWLILRGGGLRGTNTRGYNQFGQLCTNLIGMVEFSGAGFSWGDGYVKDCAAGTVGTGNLTTWRKVGTNHHIKLLVSDLSTLGAI